MPSFVARSSLARWCFPAALLYLALGACHVDADQCNCPPAGVGEATIELSCVPAAAPVVTTTGDGDCTVGRPDPRTIYVVIHVPGTCHVELAFANGTTSSTDITMTSQSQWLPCGSDPHGCGQGAVASPSLITLGAPCGDSGVDAASSD
jgi:hypothetical protein